MTPQELCRKQVEEIVKSLVGKHFVGHEVEPECAVLMNKKCDCGWQEFEDALVALLSDAECKGAWAVVRKVEEKEKKRKELHWAIDDGGEFVKGERCGFILAIDSARQVAESFGPDPEGK